MTDNKAIVRKYLEEAWGKRNHAAIDEYIAPDYIQHIKGVAPGSAGVHAFFFTGMAIAGLAGWRLVEAWGGQDNLGLTQQLQAIARIT